MTAFRFQELDIWKAAVLIGGDLFKLADALEAKRSYRFAEQLRGAALSISNNIAEGSGSSSKKDFANFLNIARRSVYENASMLLFLESNNYLPAGSTAYNLERLRVLAAQISAFANTLN